MILRSGFCWGQTICSLLFLCLKVVLLACWGFCCGRITLGWIDVSLMFCVKSLLHPKHLSITPVQTARLNKWSNTQSWDSCTVHKILQEHVRSAQECSHQSLELWRKCGISDSEHDMTEGCKLIYNDGICVTQHRCAFRLCLHILVKCWTFYFTHFPGNI